MIAKFVPEFAYFVKEVFPSLAYLVSQTDKALREVLMDLRGQTLLAEEIADQIVLYFFKEFRIDFERDRNVL